MLTKRHDKGWLLIVCLVAAVVVVGAFAPVAAQDRNIKNHTNPGMITEPVNEPLPYVPHQLVVRLSSGATASDPFTIEAVQSVRALLTQSPVYLVNIDPSVSEAQAAAELMQSTSIEYAHPNYRLNSAYPIQGSYPFSDNQFVGSIDGQSAAQLLGVSTAHQTATGAGVTVAVIDGGVDAAHPELGSSVVSGYDFVDNDPDASDVLSGSTGGHGTFVAGIVHLMAPDATIRSYRIMTPGGNGDGFTLARAIEQAVLDGCKIINLSVALTERHLAVRDAINFASASGVLVVAGAGNGGTSEPVYPAAEGNVIAVAAVDSTLQKADFSSFGSYVDICAPGTNVYSAYQAPYDAWWSGTSFSAPFVSGLAALLMQAQPTSHWLHIRNATLYGATNIDTLNPNLAGGLGMGLVNPVMSLTMAVSNETATVIPDTMHFTYYQGAMYVVIPQQSALLISSNGPAPYTVESHPGGPTPIAIPRDQSGMSNDTVVILCEPATLPPGDYTDTLLYFVEGVTDPARLVVSVTVVAPGDTLVGARISPNTLWLTAPLHSEILFSQHALLESSNAPASFHGTLSGSNIFVTSFTASGVTNDTVTVVVSPSLMTAPGLYIDSLSYQVDGYADPAVMVIYLQITDSTASGDTAWLVKDSSAIGPIIVEQGSIGMYGGCVGIYSTNAPAAYTVSTLGTPTFVNLTTTSGQTNSWACYGLNVGSLAVGAYTDTIVVTVDGVVNSPLLLPITVIIVPSGGGGGGSDSVVVTPQAHDFLAIVGLSTTQYGMSMVMNAAGPTPFTVSILDQADFTELITTSGTTDDSIRFKVVSTPAMAAGVYKDTLLVFVDGVAGPFTIVNTLTVGNGEGNPDTAFASPSFISVGVSTAVTDTIYRGLVLVSSNAPAPYTASILDAPSEFVFLPSASGATNDSVVVGIRPNSLPSGIYQDSILFTVTGVTDPVLVVVQLAVGDTSTPSPQIVTAHQNYPNPFNPTTTIEFSLDRPARVTLDVFNVIGQHVTTLVTREYAAGAYSVVWDGNDAHGQNVGSGIYFYRLTADDLTVTRKMLLVK